MDRFIPSVILVAASAAALAQGPARPDSGSLQARLSRIERVLNARGLFDLVDRIDTLQRMVQELRGELEIQSHDLDEVKRRQRELFVDFDRMSRQLKGAATAGPAGTSVAGRAGSAPGSELGPAPGSGPETGSSDAAARQSAAAAPETAAGTAPAGGASAAGGAGTASGLPAGSAPVAAPVAANRTGSGPTPAAAPSAAAAGAAPRVTAGTSSLEEQSEYTAAFALLREGRYDKAVAAFKAFLERHGSGKYAGNARYWLGESYYVTRDFPASLKQFQSVLAQFPQSPKAPGAQLKIGFIYQELGRIEEAKRALADLVQRHPKTTAARLARDRLKRLGK